MITPSYSLTATERVLPRLALDFTTAALDPRVTFTRSGNTATVTNSSGVIVAVNADIPRFDFDPVTLVCKGLLIEEPRTNVLLNSLIDGSILETQVVVVTAAARTLSFYGTGQIVLSGAHSATVTGTGAYPARTTLTFTPSAGALTLTVTGTVQFAQLEAGAFATSYIPTEATAVTRNADVATMTGTNFSDWFNASEGTFTATGTLFGQSTNRELLIVSDGTGGNTISIRWASGSQAQYSVSVGGVSQVSNAPAGYSTFNVPYKRTCGYKLDNFAQGINGTLTGTDTSGTVPTVDRLNIGSNATSAVSFFGWVSSIYYWPQKLINAEITSFSKQG